MNLSFLQTNNNLQYMNVKTSSGWQHKSSQNLNQPMLIEINCAAMTWSEQSELRVLPGTNTVGVRPRQHMEISLSDTRHTSFYSIARGCYKFFLSFSATWIDEYLQHRLRLKQ